MDTRDTTEQAELRRTARRLARQLGPRSVADIDDRARRARLAAAVREAGWLELRHDGGDGQPLASGFEAAIIADALGEVVADVSFAGPILASDLARRAGAPCADGVAVAFTRDLTRAAVVPGTRTDTPLYIVDGAPDVAAAYVLIPLDDGFRLGRVDARAAADGGGTDLTRTIRAIPAGAPVLAVDGPSRHLTRGDLDAWSALGLTLTSADLVGLMRGVLAVTVGYARQRQQYGVAIGSFQAIQHLLAEAHTLIEGASSAAQHPAWAVDQLEPDAALSAGRVAKAYCARAARTVCETAIQVHGGIGNTWECIVHVHLRRALLSSRWFGDDGEQLRALQRTRLGVSHGLS